MKELIKKKMHFNALIRSILAEIGIKTTYLVHCHVSFPSGKVIATTIKYQCAPWFTMLHMESLNRQAANAVEAGKARCAVVVVSMCKIGND